MKYLNNNYADAMNSPKYKKYLEKMKQEVDEFSAAAFKDSAELLSGWGHSYFCNECGARLIFDINKPKEHACCGCGKVYTGELYDNVWVYFYRNAAVVNALKSAAVYKATNEPKYLDIAKETIRFYAVNYLKFILHNKEGNTYSSVETMQWGCGRIMPQGLNESIIAIRIVQTLEILKDDLSADFVRSVIDGLFNEMFRILKPQVSAIHNIHCWNLTAIGMMGLFAKNREMLDFVFNCEFNFTKQLSGGVTKDFFWYEGSIHYNFFLLEGVATFMLFCEIYDYDFGRENKEIVKNMLTNAYEYAFDNGIFPNPNDGWPDVSLKTYLHVYHMAAKVFGESSQIGNLTKNINALKIERQILPLSEPYYCNNEYPIEQFIFNADYDMESFEPVKAKAHNFPDSCFAILREGDMNVFIKYGLNTPSHAHPDIMTIEIAHKDDIISRDLSNAGYNSRLYKEWYQRTISHNTVAADGRDITKFDKGTAEFFQNSIKAAARNVYEGIDYRRNVKISSDSVEDEFIVASEREAVYDYIIHLEPDIILNLPETAEADLGYAANGYEHICDVRKAVGKCQKIDGQLNCKKLTFSIDLEGKELYILKTMDNPVAKTRTALLVRTKGTGATFNLRMSIK